MVTLDGRELYEEVKYQSIGEAQLKSDGSGNQKSIYGMWSNLKIDIINVLYILPISLLYLTLSVDWCFKVKHSPFS